MMSEIFVLSVSGEPIVWKKYRGDVPKDCPGVFFRKLKESKAGPFPPYMVENGVRYFHIKRQSLYFVGVTKNDMLPVYVIELLARVYHLLRDFCGEASEEALRINLVLVHELLEEVMDYGFVQLSSTEKLKPYIQSEPIPPRGNPGSEVLTPGLFGIEHRIVPSSAASKPVIRSRTDQELRNNEIFIDVVERMSVLIAANGSTVRSEVFGQVNMKSFLVGRPDIKIGVNEDLTIGHEDGRRGYGNIVHLDDCSFHECVKLDEFEESRILTIHPPEGEFPVMTYNLRGDLPHSLPFRLMSYLNNKDSSRDVEVGLKLLCDIPSTSHAVNLTVNMPVPKNTAGLSQQLSGPGQSAELLHDQKKVTWKIKKIHGKSEASAHFKLIFSAEGKPRKVDVGPVAMDFEISGFVCSNLQIRFLRVFDREHSYVPMRWVRYVTVTDSYIFKIGNE